MPTYRQYLYLKTTAPTVDDDFLDGYETGDRWLDTTNGKIYDLINSAASNALWLRSGIDENLLPDGTLINGKLSVTENADDLIIDILTMAGGTPTADNPVGVKINGTVRYITGSVIITLPDATNWGNAGSAELATKEIDWFAYLGYSTAGGGSVVKLSISRYPAGNLVSDFSATTTNEKHLYDYANFQTTDSVVNIGRFAATLSAGAGYTWTVPTFTNKNLINRPTFESRVLDWTPAHSRTGGAYGNAPTVNDAKYQVVNNRLMIYERHTQHGTPGSSGFQTVTLPWLNGFASGQIIDCANVTAAVQQKGILAASSNSLTLYKYDGTAEATASQVYIVEGYLFI